MHIPVQYEMPGIVLVKLLTRRRGHKSQLEDRSTLAQRSRRISSFCTPLSLWISLTTFCLTSKASSKQIDHPASCRYGPKTRNVDRFLLLKPPSISESVKTVQRKQAQPGWERLLASDSSWNGRSSEDQRCKKGEFNSIGLSILYSIAT